MSTDLEILNAMLEAEKRGDIPKYVLAGYHAWVEEENLWEQIVRTHTK